MSGEPSSTKMMEQRAKDSDWLFSQNLSLYSGEWVAVFEEQIVAHGHNLRQVVSEANAKSFPARALFYPVPSGIAGAA